MKRLLQKEQRVKECLKEMVCDVSEVYCFDSVSSTIDTALSADTTMLKDKTLIMSDAQTHGRGSFGRSWHSGKGGLYFSLILTEFDFRVPHSMIAAQAVYRSFRKYTDSVRLKWINDVLWENGKKIAGVLTEETAGRTVIGVGVNMHNADFPPGLNETATSYRIETGCEIDVIHFTCSILSELFVLLGRMKSYRTGDILAKWEDDSGIRNRKVRIVQEGHAVVSGTAKGINKDTGALIVTTQGRDMEVYEGSLFYE